MRGGVLWEQTEKRWTEVHAEQLEEGLRLKWKTGRWGQGGTVVKVLKDQGSETAEDQGIVLQADEPKDFLFLPPMVSSDDKYEIWCKWQKLLKDVNLSCVEDFDAYKAGYVDDEGPVHVGDVCTFCSGDDKPYFGKIEAIIRALVTTRDRQGHWVEGRRVEARVRGRADYDSRDEEWLQARVFQRNKDGTYTIKFDNQDVDWNVNWKDIRDIIDLEAFCIVRWYYRREDLNMDLVESSRLRQLLGCKGEVLQSDHFDVTSVNSIDSTFCSVDFVTSGFHDRSWYAQKYDSWMHNESSWSKQVRRSSTEPLTFCCSFQYNHESGAIDPVVVSGSARQMLEQLERKKQQQEQRQSSQQLDDKLVSNPERKEIQKELIRQKANPKLPNSNGKPSAAAKSSGSTKNGVVTKVKEPTVGNRTAKGIETAQKNGKSSYEDKLKFLLEVPKGKWPDIKPSMGAVTIKNLNRDDRKRRLLALTNEYLRIFEKAPDGVAASCRRASNEEERIYESCLKKGLSIDIYKAKLSERLKKAKQSMEKSVAREYSDAEEELEVLDEAGSTREHLVNYVKSKHNGFPKSKEENSRASPKRNGQHVVENAADIVKESKKRRREDGLMESHHSTSNANKTQGYKECVSLDSVALEAEHLFQMAISSCDEELREPQLHLAQFESVLGTQRQSNVRGLMVLEKQSNQLES